MDNIIPTVITASLPPALAGIAIIGPVAASISTVSSLLISSSSAIIKDVYLHWCDDRGHAPSQRSVALSSQAVTLAVGLLVFVLSIVPPDVIWKINMFAFGGLETAFLFVLVCGLFWKRANATGALLSLAGGTLAYCAAMAAGFKVADLAPDRHRRDGSRRPHGGGNARWQAERSRPHGRLLPDGLGPRSVNTARPDPFRDPGALLL